MQRSNLPVFTSHATRTRGGVGFYADDRDNNRLEEMGCVAPTHGEVLLPGELRRWSVREGKGQRWDLGRLAVKEICRCCGEEEQMTNIIGICATCQRQEVLGQEIVQPEQDVDHGTILSIAHRFQSGQISADEAWALAEELNGAPIRKRR